MYRRIIFFFLFGVRILLDESIDEGNQLRPGIRTFFDRIIYL